MTTHVTHESLHIVKMDHDYIEDKITKLIWVLSSLVTAIQESMVTYTMAIQVNNGTFGASIVHLCLAA